MVDVSALGTVRDLDLTGCVEVVDVSALGNVKRLSLARCRLVVDVSALANVRYLELSGSGVSDHSALSDQMKGMSLAC